MKKGSVLQIDIFGSPVHILNSKEIYRTVKCGICGNTVKMSQAKTHLSYGKTLTICLDCLDKKGKGRKKKDVTKLKKIE